MASSAGLEETRTGAPNAHGVVRIPPPPSGAGTTSRMCCRTRSLRHRRRGSDQRVRAGEGLAVDLH